MNSNKKYIDTIKIFIKRKWS